MHNPATMNCPQLIEELAWWFRAQHDQLRSDRPAPTLTSQDDSQRWPLSEDLLYIAAETAQVGIALVDGQHHYRYANQIYKAILHLPPDDLSGRFIGDVLGPLYEQVVRPRLECAFRGEQASYLISPPALPGEVARTYNVRIEAAINQGEPIAVVVAIDITEREQIVRALREREAELRLANAAGDIGTWRHDVRTNRIRFDPRGQAHYGLREHEVDLAEVLAQIHPDDLTRLEQAIGQTLSPTSNGRYSIEYRVIHADGSIRWLVIQAQVYFEGAGPERQAVLGLGTSQDITARKQADEQNRLSTERLQLLHAIDQAILDAQKPEQVAALAIRRLIHLVPYDYAGVLLYSGSSPELSILADHQGSGPTPATGSQVVLAERMGDPVFRVEHSWLVADTQTEPRLAQHAAWLGQLGIHALLLLPILVQGQTVGVLALTALRAATFNDQHLMIATEVGAQLAIAIHNARLLAQLERERSELTRRVIERTADLNTANAELARAARLKDEFLANMSHELRTPLNAILGFSEILVEEIYGPVNDQQRHAIHAIDESGRLLLSLINDILDLAKIETGRVVLDPEPVPVEDVCQTALRMVSQIAVQKQLSLTSTIDSRVQTVVADIRRLKQMLVNLLANAVKFTPAGGAVGLEVQAFPEHERLTLTVWDTGIGIAPEDQPRLFKAFVQIDNALNRQSAGTGLGLALVMNLARLHGGSVSLQSAPGEGSRFSISLPWSPPDASQPAADTDQTEPADTAPAQAGQRSAPDEASPGAGHPRVLLADDNTINSTILASYLQQAGYDVILAHNGAEAVACAQDYRPALILMDIQMPVLDGLEAIRRIRAAGMGELPIIALTALAMPGDRERCLMAGANAYMAKPVSLRSVRQLIGEQLDGGG